MSDFFDQLAGEIGEEAEKAFDNHEGGEEGHKEFEEGEYVGHVKAILGHTKGDEPRPKITFEFSAISPEKWANVRGWEHIVLSADRMTRIKDRMFSLGHEPKKFKDLEAKIEELNQNNPLVRFKVWRKSSNGNVYTNFKVTELIDINGAEGELKYRAASQEQREQKAPF